MSIVIVGDTLLSQQSLAQHNANCAQVERVLLCTCAGASQHIPRLLFMHIWEQCKMRVYIINKTQKGPRCGGKPYFKYLEYFKY